jgi:hypothetical protein
LSMYIFVSPLGHRRLPAHFAQLIPAVRSTGAVRGWTLNFPYGKAHRRLLRHSPPSCGRHVDEKTGRNRRHPARMGVTALTKRLYVGRWPAETIETQILSMQRHIEIKMYDIHGHDGMQKD